MKISAGAIKGLLIVVVMGSMFFAMAPSLIYTLSTGIASLLGAVEGNSTLYGSGPSAIAGILADNWGYFLVVGILTLVIGVSSGIFNGKK